MGTISSTPYRWPFDADLRSDNTALVVIDMQTDARLTRRSRR